MTIDNIKDIVIDYGSLGNSLVETDYMEVRLKALKYLYEHGRDIVYKDGEFIEQEFPEKEFNLYVDNFFKIFKHTFSIPNVIEIYINNFYIFAIVYRYKINVNKNFSDGFDFFVNENVVKFLEDEEIDKRVIKDFFDYIYSHKFKYVYNGVVFIKGINAFLKNSLVDEEKFKNIILEFIKDNFDIKDEDICFLYEIRKEFDRYIIIAIIEKAIRSGLIICGLFINEKYLNDKLKYKISENYIKYLKENGIRIKNKCNRISIEKKIIKYICENVSDFWIELKKEIENTKYCTDKLKCCQQADIINIFEI